MGMVLVGALVAVACLLSGGGIVWRIATRELERTRSELALAQERLYLAWKDGYAVPSTREAQAEASGPEVVEPFPPLVDDWLSQWDAAGQAVYSHKARSLLDGGMTEPMVVVQLERYRNLQGMVPD